MKLSLFLNCIPALMLAQATYSQNVGIGTTSPTGPLSFANVTGNKLVLWGNGNDNHYGIGVQSTYLQLYADIPNSNIVFGHGRSGAFNERMRIANAGSEGLFINGRVHLRNGTNPLNTDFAPGVWLYKPDNTGALGFMGVQNNQNMGFYGGPGGWGLVYDAINSRVGIGNPNPNASLAFGATLGKKITLYPGATGDVGFGVAGNRLQIYSDNPNADVAIGYDAAGIFNERFAVKPNGALALSANAGQSNQLLSSNGPGSAAQWRGISSVVPTPNSVATVTLPPTGSAIFPNALLSFSLTRPAKVLLWVDIVTKMGCVFFPCNSYWKLFIYLNGNITIGAREIPAVHNDPNLNSDSRSIGPFVLILNPGNYSIAFTGAAITGQPNVTIYPTAMILSD